jgi:hypothetical protein
MKRVLGAVALAMLVVACGGGEVGEREPTFAEVAALPACEGEVDPAVGGECTITDEGGARLLHVRYQPATPAGEGEGAAPAQPTSTSVTFWDTSLEEPQAITTVTEENVTFFGPPELTDVNGDTLIDLIVPREIGNVNTVFGVWLAAEGGVFNRIGEVSGVTLGWAPQNYFSVSARSSADVWEVAFFDVAAGALDPVATIIVEQQRSDPDAEPEAICALVEAPALDRLNMTREQAQTLFCREELTEGDL